MTPERLQFILSIFTIAMSGGVATLVTYRLNARREDRQFRLQRLEGLYLAFTGFCRQLGKHWVPHLAVMDGKITYNEALDQVIAQSTDQPRYFEQIDMLVAIYWPELRGHFDKLIEVREQAADVIADHKVRYKAGVLQDEGARAAMVAASEKLGEVETAFAKAVRREAEKLT